MTVSYEFPQKFPGNWKSFLNPVRQFAVRKQETLGVFAAWLLRFQGFLGWKPVSSQETKSFLSGFLPWVDKGRAESWQ